MKHRILSLLILSAMVAASAQTGTKPAAPKATARSAGSSAAAGGVKLPPGVPPGHGVVKTLFSLRYQDLKLGTGALAEPYKLYKVHYTGWLAANGHKFDSSYDHPAPVLDKDGKPELDANGKERMEPRPLPFPQGFGKLIPGFDQGLAGMRVGGKRRLFIPWQLAYGVRGRPGAIPEKADLIFDIELIDQSDLETQMPMGRPGMTQPMRAPGSNANPSGQTTPPPAGSQSNPGAPSPAGTPPPATPPSSAPPAEKPQSK